MTDQTTNTPTPEPVTKTPLNRRNFLVGSGAVAAAGLLAACSKSTKSSSTTTAAPTTGGSATTMAPDTSATTAPASTDASGDLKVGAVAASLEVLAVNTYKAALDAATAGKLGAVPPAVATFVTTAMGHHQAALDAWNGVLTGAGKPKVTAPPAALAATVNTAFGKVTDITGAAKLALLLEETAAATYQKVIPSLTTKGAIALAASIQPIDMQHAAVLHFVLGEYPVPDTFGKLDKAAA